jgi:hypothetical protein
MSVHLDTSFEQVAPHLVSALKVIPNSQGRTVWGDVRDALTRQLGFDRAGLSPVADEVFDVLAELLSEALENPEAHWFTMVEEGWHQNIARTALANLGINDLVTVSIDLGWKWLERPIKETTKVEARIRAHLADRLASRVATLLQAWERGGAWDSAKRAQIDQTARRRGSYLSPPAR